MKKPTYTLGIPQPCHERWDDMAPTEKGRYCASCQTQVVDFTGLSDREVIQMIEHSSGKVCGRLHPQQLDRPMVFEPWAQRASVRFSGFFAGLMMLSSADASTPQPQQIGSSMPFFPREAATESDSIVDDSLVGLQKDTLEYVIRGTVIDENTKEGLPFVQLMVAETDLYALTDFDGRFELAVPESYIDNELLLKITYVGYEEKEFSISPKEFIKEKELSVVLNLKGSPMLGVVIIERSGKRRKHRH